MTKLQQKCLDAIKQGPCTLYAVVKRSAVRADEGVDWWDVKQAVDELAAMDLIETYEQGIDIMHRAKETA